MPCVSSSHAKHTLLRGCCQSLCGCGGAAYSAQKYCECNDIVGNNDTLSYEQMLCRLIGSITEFYDTGADLITTLTNLDYSCISGEFLLLTQTSENIGTVVNGQFTADTPLGPGAYNIFINDLLGDFCRAISVAN